MTYAISYIKIRNHFIPDIDWNDIPQLAVITGTNGSGKTKLLDAIDIKIRNVKSQYTYNCEAQYHIKAQEFGYIPWNKHLDNLGGSSYKDLTEQREKFIELYQKNVRQAKESFKDIANYLDNYWDKDINNLTSDYLNSDLFIQEFEKAWVYSEDTTLNKYVSRLFVHYLSKFDNAVKASRDGETGQSKEDSKIYEEIGHPPWHIINDLFYKYSFKYRVDKPIRATQSYEVSFYSVEDSAKEIKFQHLSSGERMIVTLILWSFNEELGELKKLLILDEPDAHLHPEMGKMFKEIINDVLVNRFGIQIIMTTHSPTTLCWFDEESIWLLDKKEGIKNTSRQDALDTLTAGLFFVHRTFKIVLVEDKDDQKFHQNIYDRLIEKGDLPTHPQLIFKSVVTPENGGGKQVVKNACTQWKTFSEGTQIDSILYGLVDDDNEGSQGLPCNIRCLSRYCHENYLADPLVLFVLLIEEKTDDHRLHETASKIGYSEGDITKFKTADIGDSQNIADSILQLMHNSDACDFLYEDHGSNKVEYINGLCVDLPYVFWNRSGKDYLLKCYKNTFLDDQGKINNNKLTNYMMKANLIPRDLMNVYKFFIYN